MWIFFVSWLLYAFITQGFSVFLDVIQHMYVIMRQVIKKISLSLDVIHHLMVYSCFLIYQDE